MDVYADAILQSRKGVSMKKKILAVLVMASMLINSLSMPLYAEEISEEEAVVEDSGEEIKDYHLDDVSCSEIDDVNCDENESLIANNIDTEENVEGDSVDQGALAADIAFLEIGQTYGPKYNAPTTSTEWCAYFASWAAHEATDDWDIWPKLGSTNYTVSFFQSQGRWHNKGYSWTSAETDGRSEQLSNEYDDYVPQRGDFAAIRNKLSKYNGRMCDYPYHTGIVYNVEEDYIEVVEGNYGGQVVLNTYDRDTLHLNGDISSVTFIVGFGEPAYDRGIEEHNAVLHIDGTIDSIMDTIYVKGWAYDPDAPGESINLYAHVDDELQFIGKTDIYNEEVNSQLGLTGNHGFDTTFKTKKKGAVKVSIHAENIGMGYWDAKETYLYIDTPEEFSEKHSAKLTIDSISGGVRSVKVSGWAYDPDSPGDPVEIRVWIDDNCVKEGLTDKYLSTINSTYGLSGNHGFDFTIPTDATGDKKVLIQAVNIGMGYYGSKEEKVYIKSSNEPVGKFESANGGTRVINVSGWAYDPDESSKSIEIEAYVGGSKDDENVDKYSLGVTTESRSDINSKYRISGNHGFDFDIETNRSGSVPVYLYALDSQGGDALYLGMKTVTVTQTVPVTGIKIDEAEHYINGMHTGQPITAKVIPSNATNQKVTWRSSDSSIATVTSTGNTSAYVEKKNWGEVTIYATITDNGKTYEDSCKFVLAEDKYLYGDITGDGKLSIADLSSCNTIIQKINNSGYQPTLEEIRTLDLDGDEDIDADDLDLLNKGILGEIDKFPVETMLNKIIIESSPTTTEYFKGESVSTLGLKVRAYYNDGTSKIVDPTNITGSNSDVVGDNTVTVEYTESGRTRSATYVLRIKSVDLTGITITTAPTKISYIVGEAFDKTGMVVKAKYNNGSTKIVNDYTFTPSGSLNTSDTKVTIKYKEGSIYKEATQSITVKSYCDVNGHDWGEYMSEGETTHSRVCMTCGKKVTSACTFNNTHVAAGCVNGGYLLMTCPDCGNTKTSDLTDEPALGHRYIVGGFNWIKSDSGYDCNVNLICDRCDGTTQGHIKTEKATVTSKQEDSTCIKQGSIVYTATYGSNKTTKTVALPYADHQYYWVIDADATDYEDGIKHEECVVCGNKRNENTVIPKVKPDLTRIEITSLPTKTYYYLGDAILTSGLKVMAYYEDGTSKEITPTSITPTKAGSVGSQTITVSYSEGKITKQATFNVNVSEVIVTKIAVVGAPLKTAYVEGDYFSKSGMVVQATYNNGTTKNVTNYTVSPSGMLKTTDDSIKVTYVENGHSCDTTYPITVASYCDTYGHSFKWIVDEEATETHDGKKHEECDRCGAKRNEDTVIPREVQDHSLNRIAISNLPAKTEYYCGEDISLSGIKVVAYYEDNTNREVTPTITSSTKAEDAGVQVVTISYTEDGITKTASFSINVKAIFLDKIEVIYVPSKTSYIEGETFNKSGMVIRATYNNGLIKNVTNYTVLPSGALKKSDTTVKISYTEGDHTCETSQAITVSSYCDIYGHNFRWVTDSEPTEEQTGLKHEECTRCGEKRNNNTVIPKLEKEKVLSRISVMKLPDKVDYYLNEDIELSGLKIMAFYDDDTSREVSDISIDKEKAETEGTQLVTVSYSEGGVTKTAMFSIVVSRIYVTKIEVVGIPDKVFYTEGETFDNTGMIVRATYSDGTQKTVKDYTIIPSGKLSPADKEVKISYVEDGRIAETTQAIRVNAYCNVYGHDYQWVTDKENTEDEDGVKHEECSRCGDKRNEGTVIPKKDKSSSSSEKDSSSSSSEKDSSSSSSEKDSSSSSSEKDSSSSSSEKDSSSSSGKKDDSSSSSDKDSSSSSAKKDGGSSSTKDGYEIVNTTLMNEVKLSKGEKMIVGDDVVVKVPGVDPKLLQTSSKSGTYKCVVDEATGEFVGMVTAFKKGSIKLYKLDGKKKRTVCTVKAEQPKLKSVLILKTGKVKILKLKGTKLVAESWVSSDPEVANVTASGVLTAAKPGTATVTAKLGKHTYDCTVVVK